MFTEGAWHRSVYADWLVRDLRDVGEDRQHAFGLRRGPFHPRLYSISRYVHRASHLVNCHFMGLTVDAQHLKPVRPHARRNAARRGFARGGTMGPVDGNRKLRTLGYRLSSGTTPPTQSRPLAACHANAGPEPPAGPRASSSQRRQTWLSPDMRDPQPTGRAARGPPSTRPRVAPRGSKRTRLTFSRIGRVPVGGRFTSGTTPRGCLQARCHAFAGYCSGSRKQRSRATRPGLVSGCIP